MKLEWIWWYSQAYLYLNNLAIYCLEIEGKLGEAPLSLSTVLAYCEKNWELQNGIKP